MSSEYKNIEYRYRFLKETAKNFNSGSRNAIYRQEREKKDNSLSRTEQNFLESIWKDSVHRKETIQDIVLKCSDTSFEIYRDEIKRLAWENSKLREELRQTSHVRDKNGKEGKQKERIISQKDEQIRKISQELKDMSSELNKVKAGNHKKDDQPKKGKKSRRSSNKKIREKIFEIPVLPEISKDDPLIEEARDIFFYDIPKFWSEEDVRTNLMKIGKVLRIQVRGQHKYKTVKAKLVLKENFEKTFKEGHFGICISKQFIKWYDAKLGLKERQERDKWQTAMEEAVEDSCTTGNINEVWMIRNKKTIYRDEGKERGKKKSASTKEKSVITNIKENTMTPMTPPDRIYSELGNFASRNYDFFGNTSSQRNAKKIDFSRKSQNSDKMSKTPNEDEVVDMAKGVAKLEENSSPVAITTKVNEWKRVYVETGNEMEWEVISLVALEEKQEEQELEGQEEVSKCGTTNNNNEDYWTLNDDFTKRLEDVNRYQDEKEAGDKRPILESPPAPARKPVLVDVNEEESSDDRSESEKEDSITEKNMEEKSTKAPEIMSKTQMKKQKKRNKKKNK
ncbi:unnamed protein product [Rhizophagus irregularis]|nr:unnamed protein product [Rhizophagus irregularis]